MRLDGKTAIITGGGGAMGGERKQNYLLKKERVYALLTSISRWHRKSLMILSLQMAKQ